MTLVHWSCNSYHVFVWPTAVFQCVSFHVANVFIDVNLCKLNGNIILSINGITCVKRLICIVHINNYLGFVSFRDKLHSVARTGRAIQYRESRLIPKTHSLEGVRSGVKYSYHFIIWQVPRQQCCRNACHI